MRRQHRMSDNDISTSVTDDYTQSVTAHYS